MVTLQNNFTTPEQSKRLLELGVPADSADCFEDILSYIRARRTSNELSRDFFSHYATLTPCWSVGRLIEIYCVLTGVKEFKMYVVDTLVEEIISLLNAIKIDGIDFSKLEE